MTIFLQNRTIKPQQQQTERLGVFSIFKVVYLFLPAKFSRLKTTTTMTNVSF